MAALGKGGTGARHSRPCVTACAHGDGAGTRGPTPAREAAVRSSAADVHGALSQLHQAPGLVYQRVAVGPVFVTLSKKTVRKTRLSRELHTRTPANFPHIKSGDLHVVLPMQLPLQQRQWPHAHTPSSKPVLWPHYRPQKQCSRPKTAIESVAFRLIRI